MPKIAVYTFAKNCSPRSFVGEQGVDYFAFADSVPPVPWSKREIEYKGLAYDANKYYKWHPHLFFSEYDFVVYIDATITLKNVHGLIKSLGEGSSSGINLAMHREHNTPEVELMRCRACKKLDAVGNICASEYVRVHKSEYPVPETTVLVYNMRKLSIAALDEIWHQYQVCAAHRDQLVVNYALEKAGFHPMRQQTLPGYIPMGRYTYGVESLHYEGVNEKKKDPRTVPLLSAVTISVPGHRGHRGCLSEYLSLLPKPVLSLSGSQMRGYKYNDHHVLPSQVQGWLLAIMQAMGLKYEAPKLVCKKMQFGPYSDFVAVPTEGHYTLHRDGMQIAEGGAEVLSKAMHPIDAYHDMWWAGQEPSLTIRDGEGPDVLLVANSMVIPLLPLLAAVCHRLVYIDNRNHRNLDWVHPEEFARAVIFDPNDNAQEHTAIEAVRVLAMR